MNQPNTPTLCALAAIGFVVACVAHEAIGHGGACLATGGTITVLSSSLFRCTPPSVLVDAAGPLASLVTAATAAILARRSSDGVGRSFLALLLAIAGFWAAGGLLASAVTDSGDWAYVLRSLPLPSRGPGRVAMGGIGAALYVAVLRRAGRHLPAGPPLVTAYLTAGAVACVSAAFYRADPIPALREAVLESLGASVGLLYIAFRLPYLGRDPVAHAWIPYSRMVIVWSLPIVAVFWLSLGRGIARS